MLIDFSSASKTGLLPGIASGLKSDTIIASLVNAKSIPINQLKIKQTETKAQIAALKSLQGVLSALKSVTSTLKIPTGFDKFDEDAFSYKKATLTGNPVAFDAASDLLEITVDPGAQEATYQIEVQQKAQKEIELIEGFGSVTADLTDGGTPEVVAGTFQINGINITIGAGATLSDIKSIINSHSLETGVTASITAVTQESADEADDGEYQLQLVSNETGADNDIVFTNFTTVFPALGGVTVTQIQPAQDAMIEVNGSTVITRSNNTFNDVFDKVNFEIKEAEVGTILTLEITADVDTPHTQITNLVAAYNNLAISMAENSAKDSITGEPLPNAILHNSSVLKTLKNAANSLITGTVSGISGEFAELSDIGFESDLFSGEEINGDPNTPKTALLVDNGLLLSHLLNDFDSVKELFGLSFNAVGANNVLAISDATNKTTLTEFTITINIAQAEGQRVLITPDVGDPFYADFIPSDPDDLTAGGVIRGVAGTALEGFVANYVGDGTDTADVTLSQGLAHKLDKLAEDYSDIIDDQIAELEDKISDDQKRIERMQVDVEKFQQSLVTRFALLEAVIAQANSVLQYLNAFSQAAFQNR